LMFTSRILSLPQVRDLNVQPVGYMQINHLAFWVV